MSACFEPDRVTDGGWQRLVRPHGIVHAVCHAIATPELELLSVAVQVLPSAMPEMQFMPRVKIEK